MKRRKFLQLMASTTAMVLLPFGIFRNTTPEPTILCVDGDTGEPLEFYKVNQEIRVYTSSGRYIKTIHHTIEVPKGITFHNAILV